MRYVSLCAGVGGLDRALDQVGGECLVQVGNIVVPAQAVFAWNRLEERLG